MLNPITLHTAMCDFLEKEVVPLYMLKTKQSHHKPPKIITTGHPMPESINNHKNATELFPFIRPLIAKVENIANERRSVATLYIHFGVYAPVEYDQNAIPIDDGSGYRDIWNLIETTRIAVFNKQTLAEQYIVQEDYFIAEVEENAYPYWEGFCELKFDIAYPLPLLGEGFF